MIDSVTLKNCTTCGKLGDCGGTINKCCNCWEVEHRLEDYLRCGKGRLFVDRALVRARREAAR